MCYYRMKTYPIISEVARWRKKQGTPVTGSQWTETETVITRGQLETQKQGQESRALPDGHTASNMSSGLCDHSCLC